MAKMTLSINGGLLERRERNKEAMAAKPNSLAIMRPDLLTEWHWQKNDALGFSPYKLAHKSNKHVWWKCPTCTGEWSAVIQSRTNGGGCPYCSGRKVLVNFNDLSTKNPELVCEWDYDKNDLTPQQVTSGSSRKVSWICSECDNHFDMAIVDRTRRGSRCPICARKHFVSPKSTVIPGHSLADEYPDIAAEWHPSLNGDKQPSDFRPHSNKHVWWQCQFGHEWKAPINNRTGINKRGCPTCSEFLNTSFPEKALYYYISKIYNDAISNSYIDINSHAISLDIWIPTINTAIEYDGQYWHTNPDKDNKKTAYCLDNGIKLIRVCEPDCAIQYNKNDAFKMIVRNGYKDYESLDEAIRATILELGVERDISVDTRRDGNDIRALIVSSRVKDSFGENYPELIDEWHPTKNGKLTPFMVAKHSGVKAWFVCRKCGHEYLTAISDRSYGKGCHDCAMKDLGSKKMIPDPAESFGDLHPDAARAWHPTKNGDVTPFDVKPQSNKRFWWRCSECENEWAASVQHRSKVNNPYCKKCNMVKFGKRRRKTPEQFAAQVKRAVDNVELVDEYTREADKIGCRCTKCGHTWLAWPGNLLKGHGCDVCARDKRTKTRQAQKTSKKSLSA